MSERDRDIQIATGVVSMMNSVMDTIQGNFSDPDNLYAVKRNGMLLDLESDIVDVVKSVCEVYDDLFSILDWKEGDEE